jgi:hypothetical protein
MIERKYVIEGKMTMWGEKLKPLFLIPLSACPLISRHNCLVHNSRSLMDV